MPDFTRYSLALLEGERVIHSARGAGLRPLWEALEKFKGKSGLILHDKVIGLAAAKLVVHSGIITEIITSLASWPARKFAEENSIRLQAYDVVDNILTRDKSAVCPGEVIALETNDPHEFLRRINAMMAGPPIGLDPGDGS